MHRPYSLHRGPSTVVYPRDFGSMCNRIKFSPSHQEYVFVRPMLQIVWQQLIVLYIRLLFYSATMSTIKYTAYIIVATAV